MNIFNDIFRIILIIQMCLLISRGHEAEVLTRVKNFKSVHSLVLVTPSLPLDVGQQGLHGRGVTRATLPRLVGLHVFGEVVAPHEPLATLMASEALLSGVRAEVPLQFVRAREALAAEQPVADERALAGVPAQVSLQVRRLLVHLGALGDVTDVQPLLPELQAAAGLAVGALAAAAAARGAQQRLGRSLQQGGDLRLVAQDQLAAQGEGVAGGGA